MGIGKKPPAGAVAKYLDSLPARRRRTAGWALEVWNVYPCLASEA